MRYLIPVLLIFSSITVKAQSGLYPYGMMNYAPLNAFNNYHALGDSNNVHKKWSVSTYAGMSAGFLFYGNGNSAYMPGQIGIQLNRQLNNNLYAFAAASVSPVYFNFNRPLNTSATNKNYMMTPGFNANGWGVYSGFHAGLMYVNDAKTFSISGSIGVSRSTNSLYPVPVTANRQIQQ
ncbi:MAG: hypothetical protein QM726_09910 [Chitinophagaceae bacterium]